MPNLSLSKIRNYYLLNISVAIFILFVLLIIIVNYLMREQMDKIVQQEHKNVHTLIKHIESDTIQKYSAISKHMINTNKMRMYLGKDRTKLYNLFKDEWQLMQAEDPYLNTLHFHLSDGTSFLRMHQPQSYGDSVDAIRPMLNEIHKNHQQLIGFETGRYTMAQRIITPVFDANQSYIGAIDIGVAPCYLIEKLKNLFHYDGILLVKNRFLKIYKTNMKSIKVEDYSIILNNDTPELAKLIKLLQSDKDYIHKDGCYRVKNSGYYVHQILLRDFEGNIIGKILLFQDISRWTDRLDFFILSLSLMLLVFFLFVMWIIFFGIMKLQKGINKLYLQHSHELQKSEKKFKMFFQNAPNPSQSLDANGNVLMVNKQWLESLGYEESEIIGKNFSYLLQEESKEIFRNNFSKLKEKGSVTNIEFKLKKKSGDIIVVRVNGKSIYADDSSFEQTYCSFTDVTQETKQREALELSEAYLNTVFNDTPYILFTTNGKFLDRANNELLKMTGYKSTESFKEAHDCFCDYFENEEGYLHSDMDGVNWIDYIYANPTKVHKVKMNLNDKIYIYIIQAKRLLFDEKHRSLLVLSDVTELEEAQKKLQESNDFMSSLIDSIDNLIFVKDKNLNYLTCNKAFEKFTNHSKDEIIGANDYDLFDKNMADFFREKDKEMLSTNAPKSNFEWAAYPDGKIVYLFTVKSPLKLRDGTLIGLVGNSADFTENQHLLIELKKSQKMYMSFFEHSKSANAIYKTDDNGESFVFERINNRVEEIEGVKREEIIGKDIKEVFSGVEEFGLLDIMKTVYHTGKEQSMGLAYYEDEQRSGWRDNYLFKLPSGEVVVSYHDKTNEMELQDSLKKKEEIMLAQSRHAAMGEMIGMIAHQWRQPITAIAMGANNIIVDITLENLDKDVLYKQAIDILDQTQYLSKTIDDFRNFFKPHKEREEVDVYEVLKETLSIIEKSLENNSISLEISNDCHTQVYTYSRELLQVFINILKNAKEVLVERNVKEPKISISIREDEDNIITLFCDNGGGIEPEVMERIFEPYYTTKDEKTGTGLGLYMSETIVSKHLGGTLSAKNSEDGVCFSIVIPKKYEDDREGQIE